MKKWILVVAAAFIAMILIGEMLACGGGLSYDSSAHRDGDTISYSVSSSGTNDYTAMLIDNHGFTSLKKLAIYIDEGYYTNYDKASALSSVYRNDVDYYADQIKRLLELRSFKYVTICDSKGLIDFVNDSSSDPRSYGILSISYSLPGDLYSGNAEDKLMKWVENGGSLYWTGSVPGEFYYNSDGELIHVTNCQELFFGASDCVNFGDDVNRTVNENDFTKALSLIGERTSLGLDITKMSKQYLAMGLLDGNYSSYTFVKYGEGMIVQIAGWFEIVQMEDIAHMIASKVCYKSTMVDYEGGRVTRNTVHRSFESAEGDVLFVFIGNNYSVYGRAWDV